MWDTLVDLVRASIFAGSHVLGDSLGASIFAISALVRLALLPLALKGARQAHAQQAKVHALKPELERIKRRFADDRRRMWEETQALYRRHDVRLMTGTGLANVVISLPLLGALFSAVREGLGARVRFLWVADLSRADVTLTLLATTLAAFAASTAPTAPGSAVTPAMITTVVVLTTLVFLWSASSAIAVSVGAGSAVSLLQNWLVHREQARSHAPIAG